MPSNNPSQNITQQALDAANNYHQTDAERAAQGYQGSGNPFEGSIFESWFMPGDVQQREFGQQVALQQQQNEWNSEGAKMARMKAAGINPNTAASGIAGAGSAPAVSAPNSGISAGAAGASALGSVASGLASGVGAVGQVADNLFTLHPRRSQLLSQARLNFANKGFTDLQSKGLEIALKYADMKEYQSLLNMQSQFETMEMERKVMDAQVSHIHKQIDELDALIEKYEHENNLNDKLAAQADRNAAYLEEMRIMQEFRNKINNIAGVDTTLPLPNQAMQLFFQHLDERLDSFLDTVYDYNYQVNSATFDAEANAAFDKSWNEAAAAHDVDAAYAPFMAEIEVFKETMKDINKAAYENPKDLPALFAKGFNQLLTLFDAIKYQAISNPNSPINPNKPPKPHPAHRYKK